jgi:tetratricopeptide (TPR) repeat protein
MLFDLRSGKRRRLVQVVFGALAAIFAISFIGFGIGSGGLNGGLFDALGLGSDSSSSPDSGSQYQSQIDSAEKKIKQDPKDAKALLSLARYRYLSGSTQLDVDQEAQTVSLTTEASDEWNEALDAWERYLKTDPKDIDPQVAAQMICAYVPALPPPTCIGAQTTEVDFGGAIKTQQLLASSDPTAQNYATLAYFLYSDGRLDAGRQAADQAIAKAPTKEQDKLEKGFDQLDEQAAKAKKAQQEASQAGSATGETPLQNPFGGLGSGSSTGLPPATP